MSTNDTELTLEYRDAEAPVAPVEYMAPVGLVAPAAQEARDIQPIDSESVALNLETSLRIYNHHQLFGWTQGLLQNLVRHEVLICSLRKGTSELSHIESFTTAQRDAKHFSQLYRQDAAFSEKLVKQWEANYFKPVVVAVSDGTPVAESSLMGELSRIGVRKLIAHGMHDASARMSSFFVFACGGGEADHAELIQVEMLVPFLHAAWMRTKARPSTGSGESAANPGGRDLLTRREQEVLKWVYLGKSNIEIGIILGISPLTVKNHVQEILRRLDVQNRTQAVGKAFNLHILTC